ncbi:MAG TPA: superoxide dismutase [Paludibacter sp.]|nr:superoxide dismutase [Paludibacter sp.]
MKRLSMISALVAFATSMAFGQYKLSPLPYSYSALEPYIDSTTMYIHYNLHHAAYLDNLNKALENNPELYKKDILSLLKTYNTLPEELQTAVRNNGGGYFNHTFFWSVLAPARKLKMSPGLEKILSDNFGSVDAFKTLFEKGAASRFGSGWVWLIKKNETGKLSVITTPNQDNLYMPNSKIKGKPVLALDVWEHAYYLKYRNKRADYAKAFWNIVNWDEVEKLIAEK